MRYHPTSRNEPKIEFVYAPIWVAGMTILGVAKLVSLLPCFHKAKGTEGKRIMRTFNCARVHIGEFDNGQTNEFFDMVHCKYTLLSGEIRAKTLNPISIKGSNGDGFEKHYLLKTFVLYPITDEAIIAIFNHKGKYTIRLIKHQPHTRSTMYKMRV